MIILEIAGGFTIIDDEDYPKVKDYKWRISKGYVRRNGPLINGRQQNYQMHRQIMDAPPDKEIDHINGCRFDNRKRNLRIVNKSQNAMNRKRKKTNKSAYKGVALDPRRKKCWRVVLTTNGKQRIVSSHYDEVEAARAYDNAAKAAFGEYALLNFPA